MSKRHAPAPPYNPLEQIDARMLGRPEPEGATSSVEPEERPQSHRNRLPTLRVGLPRERKRAFESFCHRLGGSLGCSIPPSQLLRVCINALMACEQALSHEATSLDPLRRPPNDDAEAMQRLDNTLQELVTRALGS